jgi:hypothetical protein
MITTLELLRKSPVAKTDVGDLIALGGLPQTEFLVKGRIKKIRAGLFFIDIEGENYTFPKNSTFKENEEIICVLRAEVHSGNVELNNNRAQFIIKGVEHV